jgi:bacterioferritin-associated ferredoxin
MIVCHCRRVTSATVEAAIGSGAGTVGDVTVACRAGGRCGSCQPLIEALIAQVGDRGGQLAIVAA